MLRRNNMRFNAEHGPTELNIKNLYIYEKPTDKKKKKKKWPIEFSNRAGGVFGDGIFIYTGDGRR